MAIRAKQLQIPLVGRPVFEASRPHILPVLGANLFGWVDVIYIDGAKVGEAAFNALTPKLKNERQFAFPIARALVDAVSILVPKLLHAWRGTKPVVAFLPAGFALSMLSPSVREVARLPAKFGALVLGDRLTAIFASIHGYIITKYFDIAREPIENAQRQARMFA